MNRTLLNKIRTKFIDSEATIELWCEALKCSVYELDRLTNKSPTNGQTPAKKTWKRTWGINPSDGKYGYYLEFLKLVTNATYHNFNKFSQFQDDPTLTD
ncbi:hypothetical protein JTB14_029988 [Gonioctena quinquepunctata]|nr:hypothetical protein JTB14_029988 [Gonioctena quinquepunctata]